jgi:hydrophobic/amphiphilic exporter-1 (mainly G- bacteria), HAE1 family
MKSIIRWGVLNDKAMNVIVMAMALVGAYCFFQMRRETFPQFELEVIMVEVPYPGATPDDVESGICQKIEESIRAVEGIKKVTSIAREGAGFVLVELRQDAETQRALDEIDREVRRIPSFPELAEAPVVTQIVFRDAAIRVAILGPDESDPSSERRLRDVAERVRSDLLGLGTVSTAEILGEKPFQIDVEIREEVLRQHGLSLQQVAGILRRENVELPGGQLRSDGQEILLRTENRGRVGAEIGKLPILTQPNGVVLRVDDLGHVHDDFEDIPSISQVNGQPAMVISVERTKQEDLLAMAAEVRKYVADAEIPPGYSLRYWGDTSVDVRDRLSLLIVNGLQGLVLVFILLAIFLEIRLAFWVAMGIPVSLLGCGVALATGDQTLNMITMFALLMTLGIVVDDAIVVGENIYVHRQMGKSFTQAAIDGTSEVVGSVVGSVLTTVIAFIPLFFVSGVMGKFIAVMPLAIIATLMVSLLESVFVLPAHLAHESNLFLRILSIVCFPLKPIGWLLAWVNPKADGMLQFLATRYYIPSLRFCLRYPMIPLAIGAAMLLVTAGMIRGGVVPFNPFPKTDSNFLIASVRFPDGTPLALTDAATKQMEQAALKISQQFGAQQAQLEGETAESLFPECPEGAHGPIKLIFRQVGSIASTDGVSGTQGASGSHVGQLLVELYDSSIRSQHSEEIIAAWRAATGEIAGIDGMRFAAAEVGPGGQPIEFKLLADAEDTESLKAATETVKASMASLTGVFDIRDDNNPGNWELKFKVKQRAQATGVTENELGEAIRNAYYGAEVMRLQRGRHEVKLMVRYPPDQRRNLANLSEIRVATPDGVQRPITELAEVQIQRGFSEINRVDQLRSITVTADVDESQANAELIAQELREATLPGILAAHPGVGVRWEGAQAETADSVQSLVVGFAIAVIAMFLLLVLQFRSYIQPLIILAIIPFGLIGAVWGHALLGLELTLFSMFGLVALAGVVVNDSIVLIEFINQEVESGRPIRQVLVDAGLRRLRPILLTSITTIAGLAPLILERSFQAKLLIPMAASLAFGLMASTALVLYFVPVMYLVYLHTVTFFQRLLLSKAPVA